MNELTPIYFLNVLYALLTAPGAFVQDVLVLKGLRSNITAEYTLQIYPTNLREETRAQNVLTCTDTWIIGGVVKTSEENLVDKTLSFIQDTKKALDKLTEDSGDFTYALLPDVQVSYDGFPYVAFSMTVEIKYQRRINNE